MSISFHRLIPLSITLLLSACSLFPETRPVNVYMLPESMPVQTQSSSVDWSLRINTPYANQTLDSTRIAVIPDGNQINSYKSARWNDRVPVLLRERLIDTFRSDGRIKTITNDSGLINTDAELISELRAFQSEYIHGKPEVRVQLDTHLVQRNNQQVLASYRFEVRQASKDASVASVVQAFGQATDQLSREVVAWAINVRKYNGDKHD